MYLRGLTKIVIQMNKIWGEANNETVEKRHEWKLMFYYIRVPVKLCLLYWLYTKPTKLQDHNLVETLLMTMKVEFRICWLSASLYFIWSPEVHDIGT
jgi:hypothetical protein